ncbi:hypothetical protein SAMN02799624_03693 [Paenibacillus sp. UNC496MF]|uniref:hypothetical protein n=1 Tax=Paenibacillus sp. UNC496MF TaxID=1502753 RepID=UPI0008E5B89C|nr:hypothetical protein [Paenibacillus sp. UNC496MF]SFJ22477.1 hypothetical protein SAMN02799624_03693 [Paenibacillus sp. UNC496MF]
MSDSPAGLGRRVAERTRLSAGLAVIAGCLAETGDVWRARYGAAAVASWLFRRDAALAFAAEAAAARQTDAMLAAHPPGAHLTTARAASRQRRRAPSGALLFRVDRMNRDCGPPPLRLAAGRWAPRRYSVCPLSTVIS